MEFRPNKREKSRLLLRSVTTFGGENKQVFSLYKLGKLMTITAWAVNANASPHLPLVKASLNGH
jgi:hypothetical protein